MLKFMISGGSVVEAEACQDGVLINPLLPERFYTTPNDDRPTTELLCWWRLPYVKSYSDEQSTTYSVEVLDGGAWDRPTFKGEFGTMQEAIEYAKAYGFSPYTVAPVIERY